MNMKRHLLNGLFAIGMIALICSFALNAKGQTTSEASSPATVEAAAAIPSNELPVTLPLTRIEDWAVTNVLDRAVFDHYIFVYSLLYKDSTGKYLPPRTISVPGYGFRTYGAYRVFAVSNIMNLKADVEVDPLYNGKTINYWELVSYTTPKGKHYTGLNYDVDLDNLTKMTPEAVYNLKPTYKAFVLGVRDLKKVRINRVGVYENTWVVNGGWAKNFPNAGVNDIPSWENGRTNIVSLNSWYCGDYNTTITIEAGNSTRSYYGVGADGSRPRLELVNSRTLKVYMPAEANVSVEVSGDLRYWSPLTLLPSSEEEQIITLDLEQNSDPGMTLFQAKIY